MKRERRHFIALAGALAAAWATSVHAQAKPAPKMLVLGDSLSAEYGLARGTGWVALLEQRLQQNKRPTTIINASVSGETTSGGRSRLPALLQQHQPQIVLIELGSNDALRGLPLKNTEGNLRQMIEAAQAIGAKCLLIGMQMPPNYGAAYARDFAQMFATVAKDTRTPLVPFFLKGVADAPHAASLFQSDRLHPTAAAQPTMLNNVWPALQALLG